MSSGDEESYVKNRARAAELEQRRTRIRELNDRLRIHHVGGRTMITPGIQSLPPLTMAAVLTVIERYDTFEEGDNDPYQEHDFGSVTIGGETVFWKIDCYDKQLEYGSPDAADPDVTTRVLTIMLASEY